MNPMESVSRSFSRYQKFDPDAVKMLVVCEPFSSKILGRTSTLFHLGLGTRLHDVCSLDNIQTYLSDVVAESTAIHFKLHALKKEKGKTKEIMIVVPDKNPEDIQCRASFANLYLADVIIRYFSEVNFEHKEFVVNFRNAIHPMRWQQIRVCCEIFVNQVSKKEEA